jgi:hypothetical protein
VTAYDDLATYQFKSGKAYDKRSVEEFRAAALTALDDAMRVNVQLEDQLAGNHPVAFQTAAASLPSPEEQELLNVFRSLSPFDRFELLQRLSGSPAVAAPLAPASQSIPKQADTGWDEPVGWSDAPLPLDLPIAPVSAVASSPFDDAGLSFDAWTPQEAYAPQPSIASTLLPIHVAEPEQAEPSSPAYEPDWLTEWESAVPEGETTMITASDGWDASPDFPSPAIQIDWAEAPATMDSPSGWGEPAHATAHESFSWNEPPTPAPLTGSFDPWRAEVGIPEQADVVKSFGNGSVGDVPYNDERLEVLFNQLDFGPPSADLLSSSSTDPIAAAQNHQGSPLRVEESRADGQPLPPPVRPWEGWIR